METSINANARSPGVPWLVVLTMVLGLFLAVPTPPAEAASGTVNCGIFGQVVGVWVDTYGGRDGWAYWRPYGGQAHRPNGRTVAYWSFDTGGRSFKLHVGCGGTTSRWDYNVKSAWWSRSVNQTATWRYGRPVMIPG